MARQAAIGAGLSPAVGATTVNKVCGSSLKAVMLAAQAIQCGDAEVIVAGGTENMSAAPYLLPKARNGYRMGNGEIVDSMIRDGLWDVYNNVHMGTCGDRCAERYHFSRQAAGRFRRSQFPAGNRCPAERPVRRGNHARGGYQSRKATTVVDRDEGPTRFNEEKLRSLQPAFGKKGPSRRATLRASTTAPPPWW